MRSMTGFGRVQISGGKMTQIWEIRSVNTKYMDIKWKLPSAFRSMEMSFEKIVRQYAYRAKMEISLSVQTESGLDISFDKNKAEGMVNAIREFAESKGDSFSCNYSVLLNCSHLWDSDQGINDQEIEKELEQGLMKALIDWNASREEEGKHLANDLSRRFEAMAGWVRQIEELSPSVKTYRFEQLRTRVTEILENLGGSVDENRLLQELVIISDKLDVTEELVRLHSHLSRLGELLHGEEETGRKLDFTLQECFREINTCGNKVQDATISKIIVDVKNELEKCREQVQNLE